jgi:hypothetical protein
MDTPEAACSPHRAFVSAAGTGAGLGSAAGVAGSEGASAGDNNAAGAAGAAGESNASVHLVAQLATGTDFSCALLANGTMKCWGDELYGTSGAAT